MEPELPEEKQDNTPLKIIIGLFLILILLITLFPITSLKLDPEPKDIPTIDIIPENISMPDPIPIHVKSDFLKLVHPSDPVIKRLADEIVTTSCDSSKLCQSKALFYFVRDNFDYVSDPYAYEYVKSARESLVSRGGDCDDASVLLANLEEAIGIDTRFVFVPGHVFIQIFMQDAPAKYKFQKTDWVNLDPTCKSCAFGELSFPTAREEMIYIGT